MKVEGSIQSDLSSGDYFCWFKLTNKELFIESTIYCDDDDQAKQAAETFAKEHNFEIKWTS